MHAFLTRLTFIGKAYHFDANKRHPRCLENHNFSFFYQGKMILLLKTSVFVAIYILILTIHVKIRCPSLGCHPGMRERYKRERIDENNFNPSAFSIQMYCRFTDFGLLREGP